MNVTDILKDSEHGLLLFDKKLVDALYIFEKNGMPYIKCLITDREKQAKPEEIVRQLFILKLMREYGYPKDRMAVEREVWFRNI